MDGSLTTFMLDLAHDPKVLAAFEDNPMAAIDHAGLSGDARAAIESREALRIRDAIIRENGGMEELTLMSQPHNFIRALSSHTAGA